MHNTLPCLHTQWGSNSFSCWEKCSSLIQSRVRKDILTFVQWPKYWYPVIKGNETFLHFQGIRMVFTFSHLWFYSSLRLKKGKWQRRTNVHQTWDLHGKYCNGRKAELTFVWLSCWVIQGHHPLAALSSDTFERSPGWMTACVKNDPAQFPFYCFPL